MSFELPLSDSRKNVLPSDHTAVRSATLGLAGPRMAVVTNLTMQMPAVFSLLMRWRHESGLGSIACTSIQLNQGFACAKHRDRGNKGPSSIRSLGSHTGGELLYWADDDQTLPAHQLPVKDAVTLDPRCWQTFDGRKAHQTCPFSGNRISVVFYTSTSIRDADSEIVEMLRDLGAVIPNNLR